MFEKQSFLGFDISIFDDAEFDSYIKEVVRNRNKTVIYGQSLGSLALVHKVLEFYCYGNKADILLSDGRPFYYLAKKAGLNLKSNMSIPDSVYRLLELANYNNWSVFVFGASKDVNLKARETILRQYPNISKIVGVDGFFEMSSSEEIISLINSENPDILLMGLPSPLKEIISVDWKPLLSVPVIVPCGGMIDVLSGKSKLTPPLIKKIGLASLYRVLQEPKRLGKRYIFMYYRIFLVIIPLYIWNIVIKRNLEFSFVKYLNINCKKC